MQSILKVGSLAYLDSFSGLVPCKVLAIKKDPENPDSLFWTDVTFRVTAKRPGFERGEKLTCHGRSVIPRDAVRVRNHKYVIGDYSIEGA